MVLSKLFVRLQCIVHDGFYDLPIVILQCFARLLHVWYSAIVWDDNTEFYNNTILGNSVSTTTVDNTCLRSCFFWQTVLESTVKSHVEQFYGSLPVYHGRIFPHCIITVRRCVWCENKFKVFWTNLWFLSSRNIRVAEKTTFCVLFFSGCSAADREMDSVGRCEWSFRRTGAFFPCVLHFCFANFAGERHAENYNRAVIKSDRL